MAPLQYKEMKLNADQCIESKRSHRIRLKCEAYCTTAKDNLLNGH